MAIHLPSMWPKLEVDISLNDGLPGTSTVYAQTTSDLLWYTVCTTENNGSVSLSTRVLTMRMLTHCVLSNMHYVCMLARLHATHGPRGVAGAGSCAGRGGNRGAAAHRSHGGTAARGRPGPPAPARARPVGRHGGAPARGPRGPAGASCRATHWRATWRGRQRSGRGCCRDQRQEPR